MSKSYWNGPDDAGTPRAGRPPAADHTEGIATPGRTDDREAASTYASTGNPYLSGGYRAGNSYAESAGYGSYSGYAGTATDTYEPPAGDYTTGYEDDEFEDYDDYDDNYRFWDDPRWRLIAGVAGAVLLVAVVAIVFATRGDDSSTTTAVTSSQKPVQDAISTTPRTVIATVPPSAPAPVAELPPETIVTVTNPPAAQPAPPPPLPEGVAPGPTVTYNVTGSRQLFDLVTVIYSDEQGFPRADINVALPWSRTVVLNPGVETKSVTATSLTGQLNCTITDGAGATIAASATNSAVATCNP